MRLVKSMCSMPQFLIINSFWPRLSTYSIANNEQQSTWWQRDGDFIRLRNLTIGYNFPEKINERLNLKNGRVYLSGFNLLTFTNYSGYDPEVSHFGQSATDFGADLGGYPNSKMILLGLNLIF